MSYLFNIKMEKVPGEIVYWFIAKGKYLVRLNIKTKEATCTCMAGTFKESGHKQEDCKHVLSARALLKSFGRLK